MKYSFWFALCATAAVTVPSFANDIVINEIMYHPSSENVREEFIELHNIGTNAVPLQGWRLSKGVAFTITNALSLAPGEYLVIAADVAVFRAKYPNATNVVGGWAGVLSNSGEEIEIENAAGENEDSVEYAEEGNWALRQRGPLDSGHYGWQWLAEHDGLGRSLELVNPRASNNSGQNWLPSQVFNGTPGQGNSVMSANIAPLILETQHRPAIPNSADSVTITAQVTDELASGVSVTLYYRNAGSAGPPPFTAAPMFDDGLHNDGLADDSIFGAVLGPQAHRTVIEFYVQAADGQGHARTWPAAARQLNGSFAQTANALYQVDDSAYAGSQPIFRLMMTEGERAELASGDIRQSNAQMNGTLITVDGTGTKVRYNVGIRIRGAGSRGNAAVPNYRVNIPGDRLWNDVSALNLNAQFGHSQLAGAAICARAGVLFVNARAIQVRVNAVNLASANLPQYGSYVLLEVVNADWADNHLPFDPEGNIYAARRPVTDLTYLGGTPGPYINTGYEKSSNTSENDWSDLINLTFVLNNTTPAEFGDVFRSVANVDNWMKYFAINALFGNGETTLGTGAGDDYDLYRGMVDRRFLVIPHDFDTILGQGQGPQPVTSDIFRATTLPVVNRIIRNPDLVPLYYAELKRMIDTALSPEELNPLLDDLLGEYVPAQTIANMKAYAVARNAYVLSQMPSGITVNTNFAIVNGYPQTNHFQVSLSGRANVIQTRTVRVNNLGAAWNPVLGTWNSGLISLQPGINRLLVETLDVGGQVFERATFDIWYNDGSVVNVGGALASDAVWSPGLGPYVITNHLTIPAGRTLNIQPGTTVFLGPNVNVIVADGGRILAQGTEMASIRIVRTPGGAPWGGITINGSASSPETRLVHAHLEGNGGTAIHAVGGTVYLEHLTFNTPSRQYVSLDRSSFVVSDCVFPAATAAFEMVHGSDGIKAGGRGIIMRNFFGAVIGYSDTIDFTGGNRPGPILQVIDNVFMGSGDDLLDFDSTDAWVEGNIFLHAHRNGSPDSASAVSGGADTADTSQVTIIGNIFYDCDHAALAKQGNFYTMINNTVVRQTRVGGVDTDGAVIIMADEGTVEGAGFYLEGNIIHDAEKLVRLQTASVVTFSNNLVPLPWTGPGGGNSTADPRLKYIPQLSETTNFTTWQQAQILKDWFSLRSGSPARGAGPNGHDLGGLISLGVSISGEPMGTTSSGSALLRVGVSRAAPGFPAGSGYTHYRWRLDGGTWSAETPITTPISLSALPDGAHYVEAAGKRDSVFYQDDPVFGPNASVTRSRTWTVNSAFSGSLAINEVLARNTAGPDLIELHNGASGEMELSGMGLTDDLLDPFKFKFPVDTFLGAGEYLVLPADDSLGFAINQRGSGVYLYSNDGLLIDSIAFGPQVADLSIGRLNGAWALTAPTFGAANRAAALGEISGLKINEWLADGASVFPDDFIELYNSDRLPVPLSGLFLSDEPVGAPRYHVFGPLSFIGGFGHLAFLADGNELPFRLAPEQGAIALSSAAGLIDSICYGPQTTGIAEGRRPSGAELIDFFPPTPNAPNPGAGGNLSVTNIVIGLLTITNTWRYEASGADLGTAWRATGFDDSSWQSGPALLHNENNPSVPFRNTLLPFTSPQQTTFYFRTTFLSDTNLDGFGLRALAFIDDGAVLYLNGSELTRVRMPAGEILYSTLASGSPPDGDAVLETHVLPASGVVPGVNVLAVEVHQQLPTSSDIVWGMALDATRSVTNIVAAFAVINEVMANNRTVTNADGTVSDWVELYNPVNLTLDLSDQSLTDDVTDPRRWVFPAGTTLAPGQHLVVRFDPDFAGPALNTGFGLRATGDEVLLFDAPARGGALLDSVSFGLQVTDYSIGRFPAWNLSLPTPGSVNIAAVLASPLAVKVNEWMAVPNSGDDWFELFNPSSQPVAIGGLFLTDDLNDRDKSPIPALSFISHSTNGFVQFLADSNPQNGPDHVRFRLNNGGESLALIAADSQTIIHAIEFDDQAAGISEGSLPDGSANIVRFPATASPAESNYLPLDQIAIHEALTHTDLPLEDAIELHNPTHETIDVSGWFLSDTADDLQIFRLPPGTLIPAGGFALFYEHQLDPDPGFLPGFALSSSRGDQIYLSEANIAGDLTGYRAVVKFGAAENGVSFGRHETSERFDFTAVETRTLGSSNSSVKVGPVVIAEIMYHPPDLGTNDNVVDEFIELQNISGSSVNLGGWRMRDAVDFNFPSNTTLAAGARVLLVSFDPLGAPAAQAAFRSRYNVAGAVPVLGPYRGKLDNSRDSVELVKPDDVLVDKVRYSDVTPWPSAADTEGSLQRRNPAAYGNDPVNWLAGNPTAGAVTGAPLFPIPEINTEPVGEIVAPGSFVTLSTEVGGAEPLSYQWRRNGNDIPGATEPWYMIPDMQAANAGVYRLRVSNPYGATLSVPAALVLALPPSIIRQPESKIVAAGSSAVFNVQARGTPPLHYRWQFNGTDIPGATDFQLALTSIDSSREGSYRVVISNAFDVVTSTAATLTIQEPPVIIEHPLSETVLAGATVTLAAAATGTEPLGYQWRIDGANIPGANGPTLIITNIQPAQSGRYTLRVQNGVGFAISQPAFVSVLVPPSVNIMATDPIAAEAGSDAGLFQVTRVGTTNFAIMVNLARSGSASSGADFNALPTSVHLPAGQISALIPLVPVNDAAREGAETVSLQVTSGSGYIVGAPNSDTVTIFDDDNAAPTISITSPAAGTLYPITPTNVHFTVNAADSDGSVQRVDYYNNGTNYLGSSDTAPFSFIWTNAAPGTNTSVAYAIDELAAAGSSASLTFFVNIPPKVAINSPADGTAFPPGSNVVLRASASDADGTIVGVEFFEGATSLGAISSAPFNLNWSNSEAGVYSIRAVATDNRGMASASTPTDITLRLPNNTFADMFADRGDMVGYFNTINGSNATATREPNEPRAYNNSTRTVWLRWVAPASGTCVIHTFGSSFDTVLAVFTNNPPNVQSLTNMGIVAENDDDGGLQSLVVFQALEDTPYQIRVEGFGGAFGEITLTESLATRAPRVFAHPQPVLVATGGVANFSFSATATVAFTNQWRLNGVNVPGATNFSLTVSNVVAGKDGDYAAFVGNAFGFDISQPARLELGSRPRVVVHPVSQTVTEGTPVTITATVVGSLPMTYRWRRGTVYVREYTTNSLTGMVHFPSVHLTNAGSYTVGVTNILGPGILSQAGVLTVLADADRDGAPDTWENLYAFDPNDPADALQDTDGDSVPNWKEYVAGTHPRDPTSYLNVSRFAADAGQATVTFNAVSNRSYTVQFTDALGAPWSSLQSLTPRTTNRVISVIDPAASNPARFYRLAIP